MLLIYSLKLKSAHFKYLLLGILTLLDLLKKKERVSIIGIQSKKKKKKIHKYTILKSPFINKKSREQFKLQLHTMVIFFSVSLQDCSCFYIESFIEPVLLKYLASQYLEAKLVKKYKKEK